jgi:hypothetical protein
MLLFANPAMSQVLSGTAGRVQDLLPDGHPYRAAVEAAMMPGERPGPHVFCVFIFFDF